MQQAEFVSLLASEGFETPVIVERKQHDTVGHHSHPFEARALILDGDITIRTEDAERCYRNGDVFHLYQDVPHSESTGAAGVRYLVGRKRHPQP